MWYVSFATELKPLTHISGLSCFCWNTCLQHVFWPHPLTGLVNTSHVADGACSRARVSRSELRGLGGSSPPRAARDMGSIALLSPVRADSHINRQLGAAKVLIMSWLIRLNPKEPVCYCCSAIEWHASHS